MTGRILEAGTRFELSLENDEREEDIMVSQITDIRDDELIAAVPIKGGHIIPLESGTKFNACFYAENAVYRGECIVKERWKEENMYLMSIIITTPLEKFQRREFYRLDCLLDAECYLMDVMDVVNYSKPYEGNVPSKGKTQHVIITDISGGGLRFISKIKYDKDEYVYIHFSTAEYKVDKTYEVIGKIIDIYPAEKKPSDYEVRIQFMNMSNEEREDIVKFIFLQQRLGRRSK